MTTARVLAGALLFLSFAAEARGSEGLYLSLEGGAGSVADWEHTRTKWTPCGPETKEARAAFDTNVAAFATVGYAIDVWRIELEGGYRRNKIDSYIKEGWSPRWDREDESQPSGELSEASLMANVIYDVHLFERFSIRVGVGAGGDYAHFKLDTHWAPVDESDLHFAYQGLAGANYALSDATVVFVNYRYMDVNGISFDPTPYVHLAGRDFEKQAVTAGVRFALFAPAAAPLAPAPATPAAPLAREFMVFFGFNQSSLTAEARATLKQVVSAVHESGSAAIRVVGHTDLAGSVAYNMALSVRRAKSVQKALIAEGVQPETISIAGRGKSEPLVPTADGVREPQNRRVHITF
jgi:OOP family OmpA-OmpF porin